MIACVSGEPSGSWLTWRELSSFLNYAGVLLKDAGTWMLEQTERVKKASLKMADDAGRPVQYVNDPSARKEEIGRKIGQKDGIRQGLVCVLTAVEPCCSFDVQRNREKKKLELVSRSANACTCTIIFYIRSGD